MDKINAHTGMVGKANDVAERQVLGEIVVDEVDVVTLILSFTLELLGHVGNNVIVFCMHSHNSAVLGDFSEETPEVPVGDTHRGLVRRSLHRVIHGKNLETADPFFDRLTYFSDGFRPDLSGDNVMERIISVTMSVKDLAPSLNGFKHRSPTLSHKCFTA